MLTACIAHAIPIEATMSYFDLGVTEPKSTWGLMLSGKVQDYFLITPWLVIFPGIAISLAVIAFYLFSDAVSDFLYQKLRT